MPSTSRPLESNGPSPATFPAQALVRALALGVAAIAVPGAVVGALVFTGDGALAAAAPYYAVGLGAAVFAAMFTVWLHGRLASAGSGGTGADMRLAARVQALRFQGLLAAAFGVKLVVLVAGVFVLRAVPLREGGVKFTDTATFAVTFVAASLVLQLATAASISKSLRDRGRARS